MYSTTSAASIRSFTNSTPANASPQILVAAASLPTSSHHHRSTRLHHHLLTAHHILPRLLNFRQVFTLLHHCYLSSAEQGLILLFWSDCGFHRWEFHIGVPKWFSVLPCPNCSAHDLATIPKMLLHHLRRHRVVNVFDENRALECIFHRDHFNRALGDRGKIGANF